jgi:hypothetical protein
MDADNELRLAQIRALRTNYAEWHRAGVQALECGNLEALDAAIKAERDIILRQAEVMRDLMARQSS